MGHGFIPIFNKDFRIQGQHKNAESGEGSQNRKCCIQPETLSFIQLH